MKTHWLYGRGPDKVLDFAVEIEAETECARCIHNEVCDHEMARRCSNYLFGDSRDMRHCQSCTHRFTRYDKDPVPCFTCKWFSPQKGDGVDRG